MSSAKAIAPKPGSPDSSSPSLNGVRAAVASAGARRKIAFHPTLGYAIPPPLPAKVARRNARERNRVKQVNCGFEMLRAHIPSAAAEKNISKVETLRHAVEYIRSLQKMLVGQQNKEAVKSEPVVTHISESTYAQQQHFQYPSPLTPRTPTTPGGGGYPAQFPSGNESGYETSSYYSSSSSGLVSPHQPQGFAQLSPHHHNENEDSSTTTSSPEAHYVQHQQMYQQQQDSAHMASMDFYDTSEEDELLDVIAKWQDQED